MQFANDSIVAFATSPKSLIVGSGSSFVPA